MADRLTVGSPHVYPLRADSNIGGEVYERELLARLPDNGIDVVLDQVVGVHWAVAPFRFVPNVVRRRVDLLRGHSVRHTGPSLLIGRALAARRSVPIVLHHHHLDTRWRPLDVGVAKRADAVITVSEHSKRELVADGVPGHRVHVIYEGVARPPATSGWPEAWARDGTRLLQLGRLEARKRPWLALDSLAALRATDASLVIAGEGPLEAELRQRAHELGVSERTRFLGRVSEADKWRLYDSTDVLLFGSTLEGFGLVVAEAQSRGVPVVAAAGSATAEAMDPGRSGLLTEPTGEGFAAAIQRITGRRAQMSAVARDHARRFDWDACAAAVAQLYRDLVTG